MEGSRRLIWFIYILLFVVLLVLVPRAGFQDDVNYWVAWATYSFENGFGNIYQLESNMYNPVFHYILYVYGRLMGSPEKIAYYQHYIKAFVLLFDFAGALLAVSLVRVQMQQRFMLSLLLLLNVAYLYNTLIWEQIDAIYTSLVLAAVVLALRRYPVWSCLLYVLALNTKAQAILFLPLMLLLWLPYWRNSIRVFVKSIGAAAVLQMLVLFPFIWAGEKNALARIIEMNTNTSVGMENFISMHAFNMWTLLLNDKVWDRDSVVYMGISYHTWGRVIFLLSSIVVLLPVFFQAIRNIFDKDFFRLNKSSWTLIMLSCAVLPLVSTFFNTRMHERYWHASIVFFATYGFLSRSYWLYVLVSVAYFLTLESVMHFLNLQNYSVLVFKPQFIAALFGIAIIGSLYKIYTCKEFHENMSFAFSRLGLKPASSREKLSAPAATSAT